MNKQTEERAAMGTAQAANGLKRCSSCTRVLPIEGNFVKNCHMKDGLQNVCNSCKARMNKNWKYALQSGEFDRMLIEQQGRCAVCEEPMLDPNVDHDHATGRIRQLLCRRCNRLIGFANEKITLLKNAIAYLEKWSEKALGAKA